MSWVVMLALLGLSGLISGSETAVFSLRPADRRRLEERPLLARLLSRPTSLLVSLLLANLAINVAYFTVATNWSLRLEAQGESGAAAGVMLGALVGIVILGEILPKSLALALPVPVVRALGPTLLMLSALLAPIVAGASMLTRLCVQAFGRAAAHPTDPDSSDFKSALASGVALGRYRAVELALLHDVVDVADRRARQVMVPRVDVCFLDLAEPRAAWFERLAQRPFTDYPVVDGGADQLVGTVNAVKLLSAPADTPRRELVEEPLIAPLGIGAERLVLRMLGEQRSLAVLLDEHGGIAGVVGLASLNQTVLGEVEALPAAAWVRRHRHHLVVDGQCPLHELESELGLPWSARGSDTLGGLIAEELGHVPRRGDELRIAGWRLRVVAMRGRRVGQAIVMRSTSAAGAESAGEGASTGAIEGQGDTTSAAPGSVAEPEPDAVGPATPADPARPGEEPA